MFPHCLPRLQQLLLSSARFSNAVKAASRCVRRTVSLEYGVEAQLLKIYDLRNLRQNPAFAAPTPYTPPLALPMTPHAIINYETVTQSPSARTRARVLASLLSSIRAPVEMERPTTHKTTCGGRVRFVADVTTSLAKALSFALFPLCSARGTAAVKSHLPFGVLTLPPSGFDKSARCA